MSGIFKAYDIRGVYGKDLTDELAYRGDGIPRDASGKPLPWVWEYLTETQRELLEQERKEHRWQ